MGFPMDRLKDIAAWEDERLHPDLQACLRLIEFDGAPMKVLQHPLVTTPFPIPGMVNREYEHKRKLFGQVTTVRQRLAIIERPFRLEALVKWGLITNWRNGRRRRRLARVHRLCVG